MSKLAHKNKYEVHYSLKNHDGFLFSQSSYFESIKDAMSFVRNITKNKKVGPDLLFGKPVISGGT